MRIVYTVYTVGLYMWYIWRQSHIIACIIII